MDQIKIVSVYKGQAVPSIIFDSLGTRKFAALASYVIEAIEQGKTLVIDELDTGMIRAIVTSDSDMKFRPRGLSKNIGTLKKGETVYCYYTTSKGWRQVRKTDGTIGYVKANKLGEEYIVRQDMQKKEQATKIQKNSYENKSFEILENDGVKTVSLKNVFNISKDNVEIATEVNNNESNNKIWTVITNQALGNKTSEVLKDYKMRSILIDLITKKAIENNINGISIEFTGIEDKESIAWAGDWHGSTAPCQTATLRSLQFAR